MSPARLETITWENRQIAYVDQGQGRPVLFIHAGGTDHRLWDYQIDRFRQTHRVLAIDLPGHGQSDAWPEGYGLEDLRDVIDHFVQTVIMRPVILIGSGLGAALALDYTLRHPHWVHGTGLISVDTPQVRLQGLFGRWLRLSKHPRLYRTAAWLGKSGFVQGTLFPKMLTDGWYGSEPSFQAYMTQLWERPAVATAMLQTGYWDFGYLDRVHRPPACPPIGMIWGAENAFLPASRWPSFIERLRPEVADLIEGAGHLVMREYPARVNAALVRLLDQAHVFHTVSA